MSALPGDWDGVIVICAGTDWDGVPCSEHQLAERLTAHAPVLYVDPPVKHLSRWRRGELRRGCGQGRLQLVRDGLARLTPIVPPGLHRIGLEVVSNRFVRRALRRTVLALDARARAAVMASQNDYFGACNEQLRVVYATDDWEAGSSLMGVGVRKLRRNERELASHGQIVVTVSEKLSQKWRALGQEPVLLPNGCAAEFLARSDEAPLPNDVALPGPIVGFVGHLSDRIDMRLLEAVANTGRSMLLVGPRQPMFEPQRFDRLVGRPNVMWVGSKPFDQLRSYLRIIDVGITPYADSAFNRASFPLKTLDYLAAGRAVVSTDLPSVRSLGTDLITVADRPADFVRAVNRSLTEHRTPELVARRLALAGQHSWTSRAADFARILDLRAQDVASVSSRMTG
jgi:teichuronic acid biosynthesis glycosyltransferase TuaH